MFFVAISRKTRPKKLFTIIIIPNNLQEVNGVLLFFLYILQQNHKECNKNGESTGCFRIFADQNGKVGFVISCKMKKDISFFEISLLEL